MEVMPDLVYLLLDCNLQSGVMNCIKKQKGTTSKLFRGEFASLRSRIPTLWTRGDFVSCVGAMSLETVKKCISDQNNVWL